MRTTILLTAIALACALIWARAGVTLDTPPTAAEPACYGECWGVAR